MASTTPLCTSNSSSVVGHTARYAFIKKTFPAFGSVCAPMTLAGRRPTALRAAAVEVTAKGKSKRAAKKTVEKATKVEHKVLEQVEEVKAEVKTAEEAPVVTTGQGHKVMTESKALVKCADEVRQQFYLWNEALQSGDPERVAELYTDCSVLLPTIRNDPRTCNASKIDYFKIFLDLQPVGEIESSHVRFLDPAGTVAINSGIYSFDLIREGVPEKVEARFSFVYKRDKDDGKWKIAEHHSSWQPEDVLNL